MSWGTFIGAAMGVVIGLSIMNHREEVNATRVVALAPGEGDDFMVKK